MYLQKLQLENFRNFPSLNLAFKAEKGINIFIGPNAQGKTNILESIYLLSFPRSFRAKSPKDLVHFGQNYYTVAADFKTDSQKDLNLKIGYQLKPLRRNYQKNQVEIPLQEYLTNFQSVLFTPEDIELISGSPSKRRRLIDTIISQVNREYFQNIIAFTRLLKQRNALLKQLKLKKAQESELVYWNRNLIDLSDRIVTTRKEFFDFVSSQLLEVYTKISGNTQEKVSLDYQYSAKSREKAYDSYPEAFESLLQDEFQQEVMLGHTLLGPHRDDFSFKLDDRLVSEFCSRGEKRTFMLTMKVIELAFLESKTRQKPLLLLDDVFSELDAKRRHQLLSLTKNYQTFISTVEEKYFTDFKKEEIQVFEMDKI